MRTAFLGALTAVLLSTSAAMAATPAPIPTTMRDCKTYQEYGSVPTKHPGAMYLYTFLVVVRSGDGKMGMTYGALPADSLESACQYALSAAVNTMSGNQQWWSIDTAEVRLIADDQLRQGLAH